MELTHDTLAFVWFLLLGALLAGYAVLDGFDLGVGILHPFVAKTDEQRQTSILSIGPVWDGNEVWLVVFGGAMFAMFPELYASVFSGFYLPLMGLLWCLILRAVSIDFRGKVESSAWKTVWDWGFCIASFGATFLFGVAAGNVVRGVPLNSGGSMTQPLLDQLNAFSILTGFLSTSLFALHGSLYLYLKTHGEFQSRIFNHAWHMFGLFMLTYLATTIFGLVNFPHITRNIHDYPWLWVVPAVHLLALANIPRSLFLHKPAFAFISSGVCITALVGLLGITLYPYVLLDPSNPSFSLTYPAASSSTKTLTIGLLFVAIGMPFVLFYTGLIYRTFWGKTETGRY